MAEPGVLKTMEPRDFVHDRFGLPTFRDILAGLEKPGRDPRPSFRTATFADEVEELKDLTPGMVLEGTVTNAAAFGAFVDIGVHQDRLVHVSQLSDSFGKGPHAAVRLAMWSGSGWWRSTWRGGASAFRCSRTVGLRPRISRRTGGRGRWGPIHLAAPMPLPMP